MAENAEYIAQVLNTLRSGPTSANLDYLVTAYTQIGYLAAVAETDAEVAEAQRKYDEAQASMTFRQDEAALGHKPTADVVTATVTLKTWDSKKAEIKATDKARKLRNLFESVEQAINAVKHLDKQTGGYQGPAPEDRTPRAR